MGHDVVILDQDASQGRATAPGTAAPAPLKEIQLTEVPERIAAGAVLLDLSPSMAYRAAHIAGARWAIRPRLADLDLDGVTEILLVAHDRGAGVADDGAAGGAAGVAIGAATAGAAAAELTEICNLPVSIVPGGPAEWRAAGLDVVTSPDTPEDAACIDYLFFVHDRHSGNMAAAQAYLDWETGLMAQLDSQERGVLRSELSLPGHCQNSS
jgi:rhodanese-related sulfurtransferase